MATQAYILRHYPCSHTARSCDDAKSITGNAEVVLAGDVFYDQELAAQGLAWLERLQRDGANVSQCVHERDA